MHKWFYFFFSLFNIELSIKETRNFLTAKQINARVHGMQGWKIYWHGLSHEAASQLCFQVPLFLQVRDHSLSHIIWRIIESTVKPQHYLQIKRPKTTHLKFKRIGFYNGHIILSLVQPRNALLYFTKGKPYLWILWWLIWIVNTSETYRH